MTLCFVPCGDKHEYVTVEHTDDQSQESQEKHEYCSPLCTCACCSMLFQQAAIIQLDFQIFSWEREFIVSHHTSLFARELEAVWQPPRFIS